MNLGKLAIVSSFFFASFGFERCAGDRPRIASWLLLVGRGFLCFLHCLYFFCNPLDSMGPRLINEEPHAERATLRRRQDKRIAGHSLQFCLGWDGVFIKPQGSSKCGTSSAIKPFVPSPRSPHASPTIKITSPVGMCQSRQASPPRPPRLGARRERLDMLFQTPTARDETCIDQDEDLTRKWKRPKWQTCRNCSSVENWRD